MRYKILALALSFIFFSLEISFAQNLDSIPFLKNTELIGKVYSHFRTSLTSNETAFDITRAYLGFESQIAKNYTMILKLDIGSPEDLSEYSRIKRYAYFKNAALKYHKNDLILSFGIIDMLQFKVQEKFWDHRYLYKSFMDQHRFGSSADLGTQVIYKFNEWVTGDLTFSNGEGYSKLQLDNSYKTGMGATFLLLKGLILRSYYSFVSKDNVVQSTLSAFAGVTIKSFKIGGEFNYRINDNNKKNQDKWGCSFYSMFKFAKKWEIFARYDILTSSKLNDGDYGWNYAKDGSALIGGIQFRPVKNVNIALNYRDWYPYPQNLDNLSYLFLNLEYKL